MKVALCLFGMAGGSAGKIGKGVVIDPSIAYEHYEKHILSKNDVDVYFHTWESGVEKDIVNLYKPVDYIVEPWVEFNNNPDKHRALSRWYSTRKSIDILNGVYDMVMLSRFDIAFLRDVVFSDYDPEYFYASHWNDVGNKVNHTHGFMDMWFFGGQEMMRRFGQLSLYVDKYDISQHVASKQHAYKVIGKDKIKHVMYRGEDFEMIRRIQGCKE